MRTVLFFLLLPLSGLSYPACGQSRPAESPVSYVQQATQQAIARYHKARDRESRLYNGSEFVDPPRPSREHPFFLKNAWDTASVHYDGILFEQVPLLYDLWRENVVVGHFEENGYFTKMLLQDPKVAYFMVHGHTFVRLQTDSSTKQDLSTGFYDQLYEGGSIAVLAKRKKKYQEYIENQRVKVSYTESSAYFIQKDGEYHHVKSKRSALRVFQDHKKELQRFLRQNKLKYRHNREEALVQMASHYQRLQN